VGRKFVGSAVVFVQPSTYLQRLFIAASWRMPLFLEEIPPNLAIMVKDLCRSSAGGQEHRRWLWRGTANAGTKIVARSPGLRPSSPAIVSIHTKC
jgi:hypothetical protein